MSIASLMQIGAQAANDHAKSVAAKQGPGQSGAGYRDRAKERREKYGVPSPPRSNYRQQPLPQPDFSVPPPSYPPLPAIPPPQTATENPNVGSKMMEKMGWQAGQGLGRANQGRTDIIEAEFRESGVGLGIKTYKRGPHGDNYKDYKDNVKRAMFARFRELE